MHPSSFVVVLPNIRSAQNVGSIFRTADAVAATMVITCGYTPHPRLDNDVRPPHVIAANTRSIAKTALGAETTMPHAHYDNLNDVLSYLHHNHYHIAALEQAENSIDLYSYTPPSKLALILGNEVEGLAPELLSRVDTILELPMLGRKESLNVAVAAGIAMYQLRFNTILK